MVVVGVLILTLLSLTSISSLAATISSSLSIILFPEIFNFSDSTNVDRNININILKSSNVFLFSIKAMLGKLNYSSIFFL